VTKNNIIQLIDYDIKQKIIESLTNVCSRTILFSIIRKSKEASEISEELRISISTVYKTLSQLETLGLIDVEKFYISQEGKKIKLYKSRISRVEILINKTEPTLNLIANESS